VPKPIETSSPATAGAAIPSVVAAASMMESFLMAGLLFLSAQPLCKKTPAGRLCFADSNEPPTMRDEHQSTRRRAAGGCFDAFR